MSCATSPVGELGDVSRRLCALEAWWRPEQREHVARLLEDAAALPARQAEAMEALRAAEDARTQLVPSVTSQDAWRHAQGSVSQCRQAVASLRSVEVALLTELECELWRARSRYMRGAQAMEQCQTAHALCL